MIGYRGRRSGEAVKMHEGAQHTRKVWYTGYLYLGVCVPVSVRVSFQAYTRCHLWSDRDQIWHTHAGSSPKGSGLNKNYPRVTQGEFWGF